MLIQPAPAQGTCHAWFRSTLHDASCQQPIDESALADIGEANDACTHWARLQSTFDAPVVDDLANVSDEVLLEALHSLAHLAVCPKDLDALLLVVRAPSSTISLADFVNAVDYEDAWFRAAPSRHLQAGH